MVNRHGRQDGWVTRLLSEVKWRPIQGSSNNMIIYLSTATRVSLSGSLIQDSVSHFHAEVDRF